MIAELISIVLFGFGAPHKATPALIERSTIKVGTWRVDVTRDNFTGQTGCDAHGRRMRLGNGWVLFDLGSHTDVSDAYYRIGDGPARSAREGSVATNAVYYMPAAAALENPSLGRVSVKIADVAGASTVTVRPSLRSRPVTFDVSALPAVLEAERTAGCPGYHP